MKTLAIISILVCSSQVVLSQSHKYYLENGIVTAVKEGPDKYLLKIDTKSGERQLRFVYSKMENDLFVYQLVKVDKEILSEFQRSISYLKTRTKFSELSAGKGGELLLKVLGESEVITLK